MFETATLARERSLAGDAGLDPVVDATAGSFEVLTRGDGLALLLLLLKLRSPPSMRASQAAGSSASLLNVQYSAKRKEETLMPVKNSSTL